MGTVNDNFRRALYMVYSIVRYTVNGFVYGCELFKTVYYSRIRPVVDVVIVRQNSR